METKEKADEKKTRKLSVGVAQEHKREKTRRNTAREDVQGKKKHQKSLGEKVPRNANLLKGYPLRKGQN